MDSTDPFAERRRELNEEAARLEREAETLRKRRDKVALELAAIAAYDEVMERRARSLDAQVQTMLNGGRVTLEAVMAVITGSPRGVGRGEIIKALGVKGSRSGEIAVDNRLRELKRDGCVAHEDRMYRSRL